MSEQQKRRNPYSDVGLMISMSVFIVMIVKCLLFNVSIVSIGWIVLCGIYFIISYKYDSEDKIIKHSTTAFIVLSVLLFASIVIFDQNAKPKMHAFEGAKKDTLIEEEFKMKKDPTVNEETLHDMEAEDTITISTDSITETETPESESLNNTDSPEPTTEEETENQDAI